jgi:hypothetical protein
MELPTPGSTDVAHLNDAAVQSTNSCENRDGLGPSRVPPEFVGLDDPRRWSIERNTGFRFRRATRAELEANTHWHPGTFLVETKLLKREASAGMQLSEPLVFPVWDGIARPIDLQSLGADPEVIEDGIVEIEMHESSGLSVRHGPNYFRYLTPATRLRTGGWDIDDAAFLLVATDDGSLGLAGDGLVDDYFMTVASLEEHERFDSVSASGGSVNPDDVVVFHLLTMTDGEVAAYGDCAASNACQDLCMVWKSPVCDAPNCGHPCPRPFKVNIGQCSDGWDNDNDGEIDDKDMCEHNTHCDPANGWPQHHHKWEGGETFFVTATIDYCSDHMTNWRSELYKRSVAVMGHYAEKTSHGPYDVLTGEPRNIVRWGGSQCWVLDEPSDAKDCQNKGTNCGAFAGGSHYYPFKGDARDPDAHIAKAWPAVHHASQVGLITPVTLTHVVTNSNLDDPDVVSGNLCGKSQDIPATASVAGTYQMSGCNSVTSSHEVGHNMGLTHCHALPCDADGCTIMESKDSVECPSTASRINRFNSKSAADLLPMVQDGSSPGPLRLGAGY